MRHAQSFDHAKATLHHAAVAIELLRRELEQPQRSRQGESLLRGALHDLDKRYEPLSEAYLALISATTPEIAQRWQSFLAAYDSFLETSRLARLEIIRCGDSGDLESNPTGKPTHRTLCAAGPG